MTTDTNTLAPTDAELLAHIKRAIPSLIGDAMALRVARAVLAKWGAPAPARPVASSIKSGAIFWTSLDEIKDSMTRGGSFNCWTKKYSNTDVELVIRPHVTASQDDATAALAAAPAQDDDSLTAAYMAGSHDAKKAARAAAQPVAVPLEPTSKQLVFMAGAILHQQHGTADSRHPDWHKAVEQAESAYRAMLAAAPQPAAQAQDAQELRTDVARAIWEVMREYEDNCDLELEDLNSSHQARLCADAAIAAKKGGANG